MRKIFLLFVFFAASCAFAADRYRVATGDWNAPNSWSATSGGAGGASIPTSSDNVFFDSQTPLGTHNINITAYAANIDFTGFSGTLSGTAQLNVYGNLTLSSTMTNSYTGEIVMAGSGTSTITSNGKTIDRITFNGSGTFRLADKMTITRNSTTVAGFNLQNGTFDPNGKTVEFSGASNYIMGNPTFYNLVKTGTVATTNEFVLSGNITVTNDLNINGNSSINRVLIRGYTPAVQQTITANAVNFSNVDFKDIKGAGNANWNLSSIPGGSGDAGGNSGITFTTPMTCYWVSNTGNWSDVTKWRTSSGGSTQARVPLPQDTAIFDGNSFTTSGQTVTQNMPRIGSVYWIGVKNNPSWTTSTVASVFGSIVLDENMTLTASTQAYTLEGRGNYFIKSAGKIWEKAITLQAPGGTYTLLDNFTMGSSRTFTLTYGTFDANDYNVTMGFFSSSNSNVRTIKMGSGVWELNGNGNQWTCTTSTNLTLYPGKSTIKLTGALTAARTFAGGGLTYYDLEHATTGAYPVIISGSNTFNNIKILPGRWLYLTAGTVTKLNSLTAVGEPGNLIRIWSSTSAAHYLEKQTGGIISCDYLDLNYSWVSPANAWYAGTNSVNNGNNSNWMFQNWSGAPYLTFHTPSGEIVSGTKDIGFWVKDEASGTRGLYVDIYYSSTKGSFSNEIIKGADLLNRDLFSCENYDFIDYTYCTYSWNTLGLIDGNYFIDMNIYNSLGNWDADSSASSFMVDNNAPITTDNAPSGWQSSSFNVTLTCYDSKSGCGTTYYRLNSGPWRTGNTVSISRDGNHLIEYYSVDLAGNAEDIKSCYAALRIGEHTFTVGVQLDGNYRNYSLYIPSFINGTQVGSVTSRVLTSGFNIDYAGFQSANNFFGLISTGSCYEMSITNVNPSVFNLYATHFWTPGYGKEFFFVFGPCTYNSIEKNRYAYREGEFLRRVNPVFCYPAESTYKVQTGLDYSRSSIDINSDLHLGPGTHTLLIENVGVRNNRVLVKITKR